MRCFQVTNNFKQKVVMNEIKTTSTHCLVYSGVAFTGNENLPDPVVIKSSTDHIVKCLTLQHSKHSAKAGLKCFYT